MPRDPYARVRSGDQLAGLPGQAWNAFLDLTDERRLGPGTGAGRLDTGVEFRVLNTTANAVDQFGILQVNAPLNLQTDAPNLFYAETILRGVAPAADKTFVVFQEPVKAGGIGRARLLGVTSCLVNVTDAAHEYAAPTTATNKLTSATTGPARIIHKPSGTGDKWCKVVLTGSAPAAATAGPTVVNSLAGSDTITSSGGASDSGTLFTQGSISGKGLYWIYQAVWVIISSSANERLAVNVRMVPGSTPSGVTLYAFNNELPDLPVADAYQFATGSVGLCCLVNVADPATAAPSFSLTWTSTAAGAGSVTGTVNSAGFVVRLRSDA